MKELGDLGISKIPVLLPKTSYESHKEVLAAGIDNFNAFLRKLIGNVNHGFIAIQEVYPQRKQNVSILVLIYRRGNKYFHTFYEVRDLAQIFKGNDKGKGYLYSQKPLNFILKGRNPSGIIYRVDTVNPVNALDKPPDGTGNIKNRSPSVGGVIHEDIGT
jgi:hypothetical protein